MYNNGASISQVFDKVPAPGGVVHTHNRHGATTEIREVQVLADPVIWHAFHRANARHHQRCWIWNQRQPHAHTGISSRASTQNWQGREGCESEIQYKKEAGKTKDKM